MFIHNIDPVLLHLGPFSIRYYGLVYALGFLFVTHSLIKSLDKKPIIHLTKEKATDMMMWGIIWLVLGARMFHVITDLPFYLNNPLLIPAVWRGGMAFFGGFIGVSTYIYFFSKKNKISLFEIGDRLITPIPLILGLGRIANFINAEHVGYVTTLPWAVKFPGIEGFRHPVQIYEAITMFLLFFILMYLSKKKLKKGSLFLFFMLFYGIFRVSTEFFRIDMVKLSVFTDAHWLSIIFFIIGLS